MKIVLSHPTGNENLRAVASGLIDENMLYSFNTTVATFPGNIFDRLGSFSLFAEFKRRCYEQRLQPFTKARPMFELIRTAAPKIKLGALTRHETGLFSIDAVYQRLDKRVAAGLKSAKKNGADAVYAYEDGAFYSFLAAKQLGLQCLYDLPIGYWGAARRILGEERERWPDWAPTLTGFADSDLKLAHKDKELLLADRIFVASTFTASTLNDFPSKLARVEVIPYGFPAVSDTREYLATKNRPIKLLFVGGLSQRKGIAYLFAAVKKLSKYVELTVVGNKPINTCLVLDEELKNHRWIPSLPHDKVLSLMRQHDVLIFPSLFEGFGLVITEAMAQGTPVITTDRTAGPDIISNGKNGWLIEAGSTEKLVEAIENIVRRPELIEAVGRSASETAKKRPWVAYGEELCRAIIH
jgi:glycosyltransferase involved in cell wall biosynthesis